MSGRLVAIVGPSGVGKDSVLTALAEAEPGLGLVRRTITRAPGLGGEAYDPVSEADFAAAAARGAFCLHWRAHGLRYGIPLSVLHEVRDGADRLANLSRSVLAEAHALFPRLLVLSLTASADTLAARIADRGRESRADIAARLARPAPAYPAHLDIRQVSNDGPLEHTVEIARQHLRSHAGSAAHAAPMPQEKEPSR